MINITRPYQPDLAKYNRYLEQIYQHNWLTNNGPLYRELTERLQNHLGVKNLLLVCNGTMALQLAYRLYELEGRILTTPYTFAATPGSIAWQGCQNHFMDIDAQSLNLDLNNIESCLSTSELAEVVAVVGVHVFGNPCDIEQHQALCSENGWPLIYDAAHCFGVNYKGRSLLSYGDIATLSLHATKLFHCVEGGALVIKDDALFDKAKRLINFGFNSANVPTEIGINAKLSEFHAAMGLCVLDDIDTIIERRVAIADFYQEQLSDWVEFQQWDTDATKNGAYAPVLLKDEQQVLRVQRELSLQNIQTRRYFWPDLSHSECYRHNADTPIATQMAKRSLCLPMYAELTLGEQKQVVEQLKSILAG